MLSLQKSLEDRYIMACHRSCVPTLVHEELISCPLSSSHCLLISTPIVSLGKPSDFCLGNVTVDSIIMNCQEREEGEERNSLGFCVSLLWIPRKIASVWNESGEGELNPLERAVGPGR